LLLAIMLDPDPGQPLDSALVQRTCKGATLSLKTSTELTRQLADLWRLRSVLATPLEHNSRAIRALREPMGLLALELTQAWNREWSAESEGLKRLKAWFGTLPEARIHPGFLPSGQRLMEAGLRPGPALGQLLREVEDAALDGRIDGEAEALDWALSRSRES
jgi:hypothetical protein